VAAGVAVEVVVEWVGAVSHFDVRVLGLGSFWSFGELGMCE
jgi:hypothetical protein